MIGLPPRRLKSTSDINKYARDRSDSFCELAATPRALCLHFSAGDRLRAQSRAQQSKH